MVDEKSVIHPTKSIEVPSASGANKTPHKAGLCFEADFKAG